MTGPPDRDSFQNVQVCLLCDVDNTEYEDMFPVQRILRKATQAHIVKLVHKFSSADGAAVDQDKLRPYVQPYSQGAFEVQQFEYGKVGLKRTCETEKYAMDFELRSEVFRRRLVFYLPKVAAA